MTVFGALSWIAGVIMLTICTNVETFGTSLPNMDSERFYNSFRVAVILNLALFVFGLLCLLFFVLYSLYTFDLAFFFIFLFLGGCPVTFFGCITFYGWPYIHGDCKTAIEQYHGPSSNNFTIILDSKIAAEWIGKNYTEELEFDVEKIISQKLLAGPTAECLVDDDCIEKFEVCYENRCHLNPLLKQWEITEPDSCAKGRDCGEGNTCYNGTCVPNHIANAECGSKLDCKEPGLPKCESGACVASVAELNSFGYEYGQIFYQTNCKLLTNPENSSQQKEMDFFCEYIYESDAILFNVLNGHYDIEQLDDSVECKLLELQFRDFQLEMVNLSVLEIDGLKLTNCVTESSLITTPEPPVTTE